MKIEITGNVHGKDGKLTGVQDLPDGEAKRLISLKVAIPFKPAKPGNNSQPSKDEDK